MACVIWACTKSRELLDNDKGSTVCSRESIEDLCVGGLLTLQA